MLQRTMLRQFEGSGKPAALERRHNSLTGRLAATSADEIGAQRYLGAEIATKDKKIPKIITYRYKVLISVIF
jgi:hypothetical protein